MYPNHSLLLCVCQISIYLTCLCHSYNVNTFLNVIHHKTVFTRPNLQKRMSKISSVAIRPSIKVNTYINVHLFLWGYSVPRLYGAESTEEINRNILGFLGWWQKILQCQNWCVEFLFTYHISVNEVYLLRYSIFYISWAGKQFIINFAGAKICASSLL